MIISSTERRDTNGAGTYRLDGDNRVLGGGRYCSNCGLDYSGDADKESSPFCTSPRERGRRSAETSSQAPYVGMKAPGPPFHHDGQ